jgi:hypothetical protein
MLAMELAMLAVSSHDTINDHLADDKISWDCHQL